MVTEDSYMLKQMEKSIGAPMSLLKRISPQPAAAEEEALSTAPVVLLVLLTGQTLTH